MRTMPCLCKPISNWVLLGKTLCNNLVFIVSCAVPFHTHQEPCRVRALPHPSRTVPCPCPCPARLKPNLNVCAWPVWQLYLEPPLPISLMHSEKENRRHQAPTKKQYKREWKRTYTWGFRKPKRKCLSCFWRRGYTRAIWSNPLLCAWHLLGERSAIPSPPLSGQSTQTGRRCSDAGFPASPPPH